MGVSVRLHTILTRSLALIGWGRENKFGKIFFDDVQEGDFILIAQGSNKNKRLFLGGIVSSRVDQLVFSGAPRSIFYRKLKDIIGMEILNSLQLDFEGAAYGSTARIPAIYKLHPDSNLKDQAIVEKLQIGLNISKKKAMHDFLKSILTLKRQIIMQGPPGTGKTFLAKNLSEIILFGDISADKQEQANKLEKSGRFKLVQFHPSYTYDDFVRGIQADSEDGSFRAVNKVFGEFCDLALKNYIQSKPDMANSLEVDKQEWLDDKIKREVKDPDPYIFIIDEINRANLPSVLGELIYALEYRDKPVESMYALSNSGNSLIIPSNLLIIGTMNTADRSVGHIDYAIRRRFAFVDVLPRLDPVHDSARIYFQDVSSLFVKNQEEVLESGVIPVKAESLSLDFRPEDVWIGHSYFLTDKTGPDADQEIKIKMKYEVVPLLKEYLKDGILVDEDKVKKVIDTISQ